MEEKKVRRAIQFNDIEKMDRFCMLYEDLIQTLNSGAKGRIGNYHSSSMEGYEYEFVFHMSKDNFDMLKKNSIVKKIRQSPYKNDWLKGYKKDIWVLC